MKIQKTHILRVSILELSRVSGSRHPDRPKKILIFLYVSNISKQEYKKIKKFSLISRFWTSTELYSNCSYPWELSRLKIRKDRNSNSPKAMGRPIDWLSNFTTNFLSGHPILLLF